VDAWEGAVVASWAPPACAGWHGSSFRSLVALAGRFDADASASDLLSRIGSVSTLRGTRYWSTTDESWDILITDASALDGPNAARRRPDFSLAEMKAGKDLFYLQADNRASAPVIYRMRVEDSGPDRIAVSIENFTPVKWHFITLFPAGSLRLRYWIDRLRPDVWGIYLLSGETSEASWLTRGHEASYVSRDAAIYWHLLGIPAGDIPPRVSAPLSR